MSNIFSKNISVLFAVLLFVVSGFFANISKAFAEIPGKYLSADLGDADLMGIASKYPKLFSLALLVFIVACVAYGSYYLAHRKKA